jgi:hypothetical protein
VRGASGGVSAAGLRPPACFEDDGFEPLAHAERRRDDTGWERGAWFHYVNDPIGTPERLIGEDGEIAAEYDRTAWGISRCEREPMRPRRFGCRGSITTRRRGSATTDGGIMTPRKRELCRLIRLDSRGEFTGSYLALTRLDGRILLVSLRGGGFRFGMGKAAEDSRDARSVCAL